MSPSYELHTAGSSSSVGIVIGVILSLLSGTFSAEWGRPQYSYSPRPIFYIEDLGSSHSNNNVPLQPRGGQKRLVVYYGPTKECDLVGDPSGIQMHMKGVNSTSAAIIHLSHGAMKRLIVSAYFETNIKFTLHYYRVTQIKI